MALTSTPWGMVQHYKKVADGIEKVSTSSHGGVRLNKERNDIIMKRFPDFRPWAGSGWYEEDCDECLVVYCFPEFYSHEAVEICRKYVQSRTGDGKYYGREVMI